MCTTPSGTLGGKEAAGSGVRQTDQVRVGQGAGGVQSRNFSNERIYSTGWRARVATLEGIQHTYPWIEEQVRKTRAGK